MLLNEERLRELYAAGEIDLAELERSLDIINSRRQAAAHRQPSREASAPLTLEEKAQMMDDAAALREAHPELYGQSPRPEPLRACPNCKTGVESFDPHTMLARCRRCGPVSLNPYDRAPHPRERDSSGWIIGGILPVDGPLDLF